MWESSSSESLFSGSRPTAETIVRRIHWLLNTHLRRRQAEIAAKLGVSRNTIARYCDVSCHINGHGAKAGLKITVLIKICEALGLDWANVNVAATSARTPEEMLEIAESAPGRRRNEPTSDHGLRA